MSHLDLILEHLPSTAIPATWGDPTASDAQKIRFAAVITLANSSGWSAEKVAHKLSSLFAYEHDPADVWDLFHKWLAAVRINLQSPDSQRELHAVIEGLTPQLGITGNDVTLDHFCRPVQVPHSNIWYLEDSKVVLFKNYTPEARKAVRKHLIRAAKNSVLALPTSIEKPIIDRLGPKVAAIFDWVLRAWCDDVFKLIPKTPFRTPHHEVVPIMVAIQRRTKQFKLIWEKYFGIMDKDRTLYKIAPHGRPAVNVKSTGAASQILMHSMLDDRVKVLQERRLRWRQKMCFLEGVCFLKEIPHLEPPADKECPICTTEYCTEMPEGTMEAPLRMIACCGNYLGSKCLRRWVKTGNASCPICREKLSFRFCSILISPRRTCLSRHYCEANDPSIHELPYPVLD